MTEPLNRIADPKKLPRSEAGRSRSASAHLIEMIVLPASKSPDPNRNSARIMRDQIETWVDEGGAGDDVTS